jgi:pSer/pThr/pTyr-binding forkhead associated (FHA) protein
MACLVCTDGPDKGVCFALTDRKFVSVGRDDDCTFQLRDPHVSRRHLQVSRSEDTSAHVAADYRTGNGTFVNGEDIVQPRPLEDGDTIRIGTTTLVYSVDDYPDAETAMHQVKQKDEWKRSTVIYRVPPTE